MFRGVLVIIFICKALTGIAQLDKADSVLRIIPNNPDTVKVQYLLELAVEVRTNQPGDALDYTQEALQLAKRINYPRGIAKAYHLLGATYNVLGDYEKGATAILKSIDVYDSMEYTMGLAFATNSLGILYFYQKDYNNALKYYERALEIATASQDTLRIATYWLNIGEIYEIQRDVEKSLDYTFKALRIFKEYDDIEGQAYAQGIIGLAYHQNNDIDRAILYCENALQDFLSSEDYVGASEYYNQLVHIYLDQNNTSRTKYYAKEGLALAQKIDSKKWIMENSKILSTICQGEKEYEKALTHNQNYIAYKDSLMDEEKQKQISHMRILYETEKKEKENEILRKDRELKAKKIRSQQIFTSVVGGGLFLVLVLTLFTYRAYRQKHRANAQLTEQNEEIRQQQEEITLQTEQLRHVNHEVISKNKLIERKNLDILSSINYAQRIQTALLPFKSRIQNSLPEHFIFFKPKDIVSGDFYWFTEIDDKCIMAVLDCTGHGIPGAFMSLIGHDQLNEIVNIKGITEPDKILNQLRKNIVHILRQEQNHSQDGMDISVCLIDKKQKQIEFSGSKHSLIYIQKGQLHQIKGDKIEIGGYDAEQKQLFFTKNIFSVKEPTHIYLYTDGFPDQFGGPHGKKYLIKRFRDLLLDIHQEPVNVQGKMLADTMEEWMREHEQIDDMLVFGAKV